MSVKTSRLSSHLKTSRFAPPADFLILSDTFACMPTLSMILSHLSCVLALLLPPHCHIKPTVPALSRKTMFTDVSGGAASTFCTT